MKKITFLLVLMLACALVTYAGSYHWMEGDIIRGGDEINAAFDEKLDAAVPVYTAYNVTASNTITIPAGHGYVRIQDNATTSTNLLSIGTATEGSLLYLQNLDTQTTTGVASITTGKLGVLMYASGSWKMIVDQDIITRLVTAEAGLVTEAATRAAADATHTQNITQYIATESSARIAGDATSTQNIVQYVATETAARIAGDASNSQDIVQYIATESSTRALADAGYAAAIASLQNLDIVATSSTVAGGDTVVIPVTYSFVKITNDGTTPKSNTISLAAGVEGQRITIFNGDADTTQGLASITNENTGVVFYASGAWHLLSDE